MESWEYGKHQYRQKLKQKVKDDVDIYQKKNNITIKCISDKILLYLRYGMDADPVFRDEKNDPDYRLEPLVMDLYYKIRGESEYTCKNPVGMAASILYICSIMNGSNKTQQDISELLGVSESVIRSNYKLLKNKLRL